MPYFERDHVKVEVDDEGFMINPDEWNETIARSLAAHLKIDPLTDAHWKVISFLRQYFSTYGVAPMTRKLCQSLGSTPEEMERLFPGGPIQGACRVAGLSKPFGCI